MKSNALIGIDLSIVKFEVYKSFNLDDFTDPGLDCSPNKALGH